MFSRGIFYRKTMTPHQLSRIFALISFDQQKLSGDIIRIPKNGRKSPFPHPSKKNSQAIKKRGPCRITKYVTFFPTWVNSIPSPTGIDPYTLLYILQLKIIPVIWWSSWLCVATSGFLLNQTARVGFMIISHICSTHHYKCLQINRVSSSPSSDWKKATFV